MRDYRNATVLRVLDTTGKRVGAEFQLIDGTKHRLRKEDVIRLGKYLQDREIPLNNAKIGIDGRIIALEGKEVFSVVLESKPKTEPRKEPRWMSEDPTFRGAYVTVEEAWRRGKIGADLAEQRVLTMIEAGLELARVEGINLEIESVETLNQGGRRSAPFMRVLVRCNEYWGYEPAFNMTCGIDNTVTITAHLMDLAKTEIVQCRSAVDIRNSFIWLKQEGLTRRGDVCDAYYKYRKEIDFLIEESEQFTERLPYEPLKLRHALIKSSLIDHTIDLIVVRDALNKRFGGVYYFDWHLNKSKAVLSVAKYTEAGLSDSLVDICLDLKSNTRRSLVPWSHNTLITRAIGVSYLIRDSAYKYGSNRWVKPLEYSNIEWVDGVGDAVEDILSAVFRPGVLRSALDVVAYGLKDGERLFYTRSHTEPISEKQLIQMAQEGTLINGVCFKVLSDGAYEIEYYGVDRFGNELAQYAEIKGKGYFRLKLGFREVVAGDWVNIETAVPKETYYKLQTEPRETSLQLKHPVEYTKEMLIYPAHQRGTLDYLGERLNNIATDKGYGDALRMKMLLSFMRNFKFTKLADTTHGNRTPVEVLFERTGCCSELTMLAATLAPKLGLSSAIIYRYSFGLDTRYHAILGVKRTTKNIYDARTVRRYSEANKESGVTYFDVDGYLGLEFTYNLAGHLGAVQDWKDDSYDAVTNTKRDKPKDYNQVIAIPLPDGYTCGTPLAQSSANHFVELTDEHWETVKSWFTT